MRRALLHAARGQGRTTPNPMVGAVIVSEDGVVVGQGWHERAGEAHAEVHALDAAGARARGATLYVTLEPCCHVGRTGPCTQRVIAAGVTRVVAAMRDPDPRVSGRGLDVLRSHGLQVEEGLCEADARRLNEAFISRLTRGRPLVLVKAAVSLDGYVAAAPGTRTPISAGPANVQSQILRAGVDAIAVGSGTVLADDPLLTARGCCRIRPLVRVIFDRRLRTPPTARLLTTLADGPVVIATVRQEDEAWQQRAAALISAGAVLLERATLRESVEALMRWEVSTLLVEGGPCLHAALARDGLIDRLHLIIAPATLGGGVRWLDVDALPWSPVAPVRVAAFGPDVWIEADVHGNR